MIESKEHAERRGAETLANVVGWSQTYCDVQRPDFSSTLEHALKSSLEQAEVAADQVGFINAQGNSAPIDDRLEATAIHNVFGDTLVTANKGNFGNLGPGSSAVELVASVAGVMNQKIPPNGRLI